MPIGISVRLYDNATAQVNKVGIRALWWNEVAPIVFTSPAGRADLATTDGDGDIDLDISDVSTLPVGGWGFLMLYQPQPDHQDSLVFAGRVQVTTVTGVLKMITAAASAVIEAQRAILMGLGLTEQGGETTSMDISSITPVEQVRQRFALVAGAL
jgi:hypothetical protein